VPNTWENVVNLEKNYTEPESPSPFLSAGEITNGKRGWEKMEGEVSSRTEI